MLYIYDPINNVKTPADYELIAGMSGYSVNSLAYMKSRKKKLLSINCYIIDDKTPKSVLREFMENEKPKDELWKSVPGTNDKYEISSYGRLRNRETNRLLTPIANSKGILGTNTTINNKRIFFKIHQLVANAFLFKPKGCDSVVHIGAKDNNHVSNLRWSTWEEAVKYVGRHTGNNKRIYKLDKETYEILEEYDSMRQAARENYIHPRGISTAASDIKKTSAGFRWCLVDKYNELIKG